jgi:hypothetical protein
MKDYWSPWLGRSAQRHARELAARAGGKTMLALIPPDEPDSAERAEG